MTPFKNILEITKLDMENKLVLAGAWQGGVNIPKASAREFLCVYGTVLYLECGGGYTNIHMG